MASDVALTDDSVAALDPAFNDVGAMRSLLSEARDAAEARGDREHLGRRHALAVDAGSA